MHIARFRAAVLSVILVSLVVGAPGASAQTPAPPPAQAAAPSLPAPEPAWIGTAGLGLALTSGNADSSTFNAQYDITIGPKARNTFKSDGQLIRGTTEGELSSDRLSVNLRQERRFNGAFVFVQNRYLRDTFKDIAYLIAPGAGLGYNLLDSTSTKLSVDAGLGGVWEKNPGSAARSSGAVTLGEKLTQTITGTTTLTQSFSGLWKTEDFADALYQIGAGIAVAVSARTQIKLEWVDTFKNKPPVPGIEKNDQSVVVAFVFKN